MAYQQGGIVVAEDPFGNTPTRPYLLLSNDQHPFFGQEYIAVVVTTTERTEAIELTADRFQAGQLPRASYVSPWSVLTLKHWMVTKQPAKATTATVDDVRQETETYLQTA